MKRFLSILLAILMLAVMLPVTAMADDANYCTIEGVNGQFDTLTAAAKAWRESKGIATTGGNMGGHPDDLTSVDSISWVISGSVGTGDGTGVVGTSGSLLSGGYIYPSVAINNVYIKGVNNAELKNELGSDYALTAGGKNVVYDGITFPEYVSFNSGAENVTFKNCTFNGIVVGSCPAEKATFDGCTFNNYTNTTYANNSNPIWWRAATGYWGTGADESVHSLKEFTFVNNKVASTRPVKIERIGWNCTAGITILDNTFDISKQAGDSATKNMAINIGQKDNTSKFILTDDGNTISAGTASLYTAALGSGSNQYVAVSGSKVLDRNGNDKVITAMVWKTTTGETFEMKTID